MKMIFKNGRKIITIKNKQMTNTSDEFIKKNIDMLIHVFKNHPNNRISLLKDHLELMNHDIDELYMIFLETGFRKLKKKKESKRTAIEIELLRGLGISVSKVDLNVAIPYGVELNGQALNSLEKLKKFGYIVTHATYKAD